MGPRQPADNRMGCVATGFVELRLLSRGRVLRRRDQVAGVDLGMSDQPVDHVDVVAAVVSDIGHRPLADIEIPGQPGIPGAVDATQPEIVIAAGIGIGLDQPLLLLRKIGRRPVARTRRVVDGANHRAQQRRLRAGEEVGAVGVEHRSIILNLVEEVLDHTAGQIHPAVVQQA